MKDKPTYQELENQVAELQKQNKINLMKISLQNEDKDTCADKLKIVKEKSEKHFQSIIQNTQAGYFFINNEGLVQEVNKAWLDLYKYENLEEVIGKHFAKVQQLDDLGRAKSFVESIKNGNKDYTNGDFSRKCKDGSIGYHSFSARPVYDVDEVAGIEGFIIDITKQKQAENELKKAKEKAEDSEAKFKNMFERHNAIMLLIKPKSGFIIDANNSAIKFYGYDKAKLCSMKIDEINTLSQEQVLIERTNAINENRNYFIFPHKLANGKIRIVEVHSSPIEFNEQRILFSILHDITERKHAELIINQQNDELKKLNADKDRFISILAHDLKSPFNSILGFLRLLTKNIRKYDIDKIEKQLNLVNKSAQNTFNLLEDILLWVRANSGKIPYEPKKMDFADICKEVIENLKLTANAKDIKMNYFSANEIIIFADKNMLNTVLRNLVSNSIKFTNKNGRIDIYSEIIQSNITITVSDNGIGIEPEILNKLFDISHQITTDGTAKETGTGLGLLLCKEFVEKHNGKIWVESELGKGSDFKFTIPLCKMNEN